MKVVNKVVCQLSGKEIDKNSAVLIRGLRRPLLENLKKKFPSIDENGCISEKEYSRLLSEYVEEVIESDKGELSKLENEVVKSIEASAVLSRNINQAYERNLKTGDKIADKIASFGGSWTFILCFLSFLALWVVLNGVLLSKSEKAFDPFPFILLNLLLSTLAAIQGPIIMMSQNRANARDRMRSEHDYQINLKAEIEIRSLHEKMDHLLLRQMQHLSEIQQIQLDLLEQIREKKK